MWMKYWHVKFSLNFFFVDVTFVMSSLYLKLIFKSSFNLIQCYLARNNIDAWTIFEVIMYMFICTGSYINPYSIKHGDHKNVFSRAFISSYYCASSFFSFWITLQCRITTAASADCVKDLSIQFPEFSLFYSGMLQYQHVAVLLSEHCIIPTLLRLSSLVIRNHFWRKKQMR